MIQYKSFSTNLLNHISFSFKSFKSFSSLSSLQLGTNSSHQLIRKSITLIAVQQRTRRYSMAQSEWRIDDQIPSMLKAPGQAIWRFKNYFNVINFNSKPRIVFKHVPVGFECEIHITEPDKKTFKAQGKRKREAETNAMALALIWLRQQGNN